MDRITLAAARELAHLGVTANVVDPGPVDTGWMDEGVRAACAARTPLGRLGTPDDTADLVEFLCSPRGGWINGQLLRGDGGFSARGVAAGGARRRSGGGRRRCSPGPGTTAVPRPVPPEAVGGRTDGGGADSTTFTA